MCTRGTGSLRLSATRHWVHTHIMRTLPPRRLWLDIGLLPPPPSIATLHVFIHAHAEVYHSRPGRTL